MVAYMTYIFVCDDDILSYLGVLVDDTIPGRSDGWVSAILDR